MERSEASIVWKSFGKLSIAVDLYFVDICRKEGHHAAFFLFMLNLFQQKAKAEMQNDRAPN